MYAPTNDLYLNPKRLQLQQEEITYLSQGKKIHGWLFHQNTMKETKGFILFFHGNGQNRSSHYLALTWLLDHGYDYFIFDYQGYGESEGKPSPEATVQDGVESLRWFFQKSKEDRYKNSSLLVFAQSLGGAVALRSLAEFSISNKVPSSLKWLILDSTFISYQRAATGILSNHWLTFLFQPLGPILISDTWSPKNHLSQLPKLNFLVMHGDHDQMIDIQLGKELYQELPQPKKWLQFSGGNHINGFFVKDGYYRNEFLKIIEN
jgi:fermentation-respiration switch protein FrsA (DUF1100 family)